jgi:hypothetical protein
MSNPEEVDQFLSRMRTLSDLRDGHDAERVKKLEEELIQGRSERLARRAGMHHSFLLSLIIYLLVGACLTNTHRTRTLAVPRQTKHSAIAAFAPRNTKKPAAKGRFDAYAHHGTSLAADGAQ